MVPSHLLAAHGDVVAEFGANGNDPFRRDLELGEKLAVFLSDSLEDILTITDEIHLIDDHRHLFDAE